MAANTEIERVRERIDAVELIGGYVPLKRAGRSFKGLCPFHEERTPSFIVFPDTQSFHCFGCGQGGDVFTFLMKVEGLEFPDALRRLADRAGVQLTAREGGAPQIDAHRQRLLDATAAAAGFFAHVLTQAEAGQPGRQLLQARGITSESVAQFGLGYAPERWDALHTFLRERGISDEVALEAGLLSQHADRGTVYDRFRGRLMFPIRDREGLVIGFGGRALGDAQPKYLNSPQSVIFDKSSVLYGIDVAAATIRRLDQAIIVEGYVDALMAHQHGYANVVATMGTALTEQQVRLLKPLTRRLVLALDADSAGQMATLRGIETLRESLADEAQAVPDARGLVRFERRLTAEIRVLTLPAGEDPDTLLRKDSAAWPRLVEHAEPLIDYVIKAVTAMVDLNQPRAKSDAVQRVAPLLRELGDAVQQSHYVSLLARRLAIDERAVAAEVRRSQLRGAREEVRAQAAATRLTPSPEDYLLGLALRYPDAAAGLIELIRPDDFTDARNRVTWEQLATHLPHEGTQAVAAARASLDAALVEHLDALLQRYTGAPDLYPSAAREQIVTALKNLRWQRERQLTAHLVNLLRDVEAGGEGPDPDAIRAQLAALMASERQRAYYPPPSPYFKDIRDKSVS